MERMISRYKDSRPLSSGTETMPSGDVNKQRAEIRENDGSALDQLHVEYSRHAQLQEEGQKDKVELGYQSNSASEVCVQPPRFHVDGRVKVHSCDRLYPTICFRNLRPLAANLCLTELAQHSGATRG
jgi:hypothetical protein